MQSNSHRPVVEFNPYGDMTEYSEFEIESKE